MLLYLLTALVLWAICLFSGQVFMRSYQQVSIRFEKQGVTLKNWKEIQWLDTINQTVEKPLVTLWKISKDQSVEAESIKKKADMEVTIFYGNITSAVKAGILQGNFLLNEDKQGCMIDEKGAYSLFGSLDVLGKKVQWQNGAYVIRGIVEGTTGALYVQGHEEQLIFQNIELKLKNEKNGTEQAITYLTEKGLPAPEGIIDGYFMSEIAQAFCYLPAWILFFTIAVRLLKEVWHLRRRPVLFCIGSIFVIVSIILLQLAIDFHISFPEQFIPTKWSDFSFWSSQIQQIKENVHLLNLLTPRENDVVMKMQMFTCIVTAIGTAFLFFIIERKIHALPFEFLMWFVLILIAAPGFIASIFTLFGNAFVPLLCYKVFLPIITAIDMCLIKWEHYHKKQIAGDKDGGNCIEEH